MRRVRFRDGWLCALILTILTGCVGRRSGAPGEAAYRTPADPPKSRYIIDVRLDATRWTVEGQEKIVLKNTTPLPIEVIALDWPAGPMPPAGPGSSMEVTVGGQKLSPQGAPAAPAQKQPTFFALPRPLETGRSLEVEVKFDQRFDAGGETSGGTDSWYPRLWWDGIPQHDAYSVKIEVPAGYAVAASGRLDAKTGRYETSGARTFGVYLGKGMQTRSREVEGVVITSLFTEKGAKAAAVCLETAADAVKFYKDWLGFYPFPFLTIVPGGPGRWGGYPLATGIVAIHGLETYVEGESPKHWQHITSHEIGHEYWGEWVVDGDEPGWLWICMGIYADTNYMVTRKFDPERRTGWTGNYRNAIPMYYDTTLDIPPAWEDRVKYDRNNTVIHSKGPALVFALDCVLGRETFERIYKKALRDFGGRRFGWRDFQALCEAETGQNLAWFFDAWVRTSQYLCYEIESKDSRPEGGGFRTAIRVRRLGTMAMPVPVKAVFEDGTEQTRPTDRTREVDEVVFSSRARLKEAVLDPDRMLTMADRPLPKISDAAAAALAFGWERAQAPRVFEAIASEAIGSAEVWHQLGYDLYRIGRLGEAEKCFTKIEGLGAAAPLMKFVAEGWLGVLADLAGRRPVALEHYRRALELWSGERMNYSAPGLDMDKAWVEARLKTPFERKPEK